MANKIALVFLWFIVTPVVLTMFSFLLLKQERAKNPGPFTTLSTTEIDISNNVQGKVLKTEITDIRPYIVAKFLKNTTLEPHSNYIVEVSDKYDIDYRLIPAIAMKESGGGNAARAGSFNAWGFENGRTNFASWEAAINTVGKTLKVRYIAKGLTTPEQIMAVYAPPQLLTGGRWAQDINLFFSKMEAL